MAELITVAPVYVSLCVHVSLYVCASVPVCQLATDLLENC